MKMNKRSKYAPVRYAATRPYTQKDFAEINSKRAFQDNQYFTADYESFLVEKIINSPAAHHLKKSADSFLPSEIKSFFISEAFALDFHAKTKGEIPIFEVDAMVQKIMDKTDITDVMFDSLPESILGMFYLYFGNDETYDGAYIYHTTEQLIIALSPKNAFSTAFKNMTTTPVLMVLPAKKKNNLLNIKKAFAHNATLAADGISITPEVYDKYIEPIFEGLERAIKTLLYIAAEEDDVITDWSSDTPRQRIAAIEAIKNSAKKVIQFEALKLEGYFKVNYVGRRFKERADYHVLEQLEESLRQNKSPHFRRGHFRNQAHGKGFSLRKVIFVPPTVVGI